MSVRLTAACLAVILGLPMAARAETVRIAYIDPLSGSLAATGQLGEQHFRFAIDKVNATQAAGPGRSFELVPMDNEVSPEKSLTLLRKAIDDGIHYVTQGNGSSVAFALSDAITKNNRREPSQAVLYLNYAAVDPGLTNDKCSWWHFRFDADVDMKMRALTDFLVSQPQVKKVYVFNPDYS
ncbi:MAG: ABC transporter substrate-binding protein, partial [Acetobacteraceae bacterium]|nr:ABC transporter substrate-binding protein [Acetobacteraceae bacterium]